MPSIPITYLLKETFNEWREDKAPRLAASLAYYAVICLAPLLFIVILISGPVFGEEVVRARLVGEIEGLIGVESAQTVDSMLQSTQERGRGSTLATVVGVAALIFGASGVFGQLKDALNTVWEVEPQGQGLWGFIRKYFISFTMVLGTGFLLLIALVVSALLTSVGDTVGGMLPLPALVLQIINFVISFAVITVIFALIFKVVPDAEPAWHDVWVGATITALLFNIGKFLIGFYLGARDVGSAYGAAGSVIIILFWVYYSAHILIVGAQFTQVYARYRGSQIPPAKDSVPVTEEARAEQGIPHQPAR